MKGSYPIPFSSSRIQARLLTLAGIFLFLYCLILTFAPAARARSWAVELRYSHWLGFFTWCIVFILLHLVTIRRLAEADPYILPIAASLSGWGLLTIYRLDSSFGIRQTAWLFVGGMIIILGLRLSPDLRFLRRYKYVWLSSGLLLTALTLVLGTDPGGGNERAWLGCCGIYLQPSEPLKLLLIVYLAAYLSSRLPLNLRLLPLLAPAAVILGLALLLILVQHDLGTAFIFIYLYTVILFIASGKKRILLISLVGLVTASLAGYFLFDVVRLRVNAWINPWLDPSGRSFQIVQSLMAVANGGIIGRGPGMGSPGLVPVAVSDFVFVAIAEETGLTGTLGLLLVIGFLVARGLRAALRAADGFQRILAAGLSAYIGGQSILIIGGNIRLLPLTGVTLPFVSYGGSSLVTSFLAMLILLFISNQSEDEPAPLTTPQPFLQLAGLIGMGLIALAITDAWWAVVRGPNLLSRTDNARRSIADRYVQRGSLLDRNETPINFTSGSSGNFLRIYGYPDLGPIVGYTQPVYGQAGLEASLDPYLRGLQGNPARSIWWDHLVYGQPPPGLDIRLSIDLGLQQKADALLVNRTGAIVLVNAQSGEILAMASHPTFDPNWLGEEAESLNQDPQSPLLDRAAQELYPAGAEMQSWLESIGLLGNPPIGDAVLFTTLGFYSTPDLHLPVAPAVSLGKPLRISPLQAALAVASFSNNGIRPSPRLAMAVRTPEQGWIILPSLTKPARVFSTAEVDSAIHQMSSIQGFPFWHWSGIAGQDGQVVSWSFAGTLPGSQRVPLVSVVLLEDPGQQWADFLNQQLLAAATQP